jgi:hypothetical protein
LPWIISAGRLLGQPGFQIRWRGEIQQGPRQGFQLAHGVGADGCPEAIDSFKRLGSPSILQRGIRGRAEQALPGLLQGLGVSAFMG